MNRSSPSLISVWHAANSPDQPGFTEHACESFLDEADLERANLFRRPTTRNQHVIGRGMTRKLLSRETVDPRSIRFSVEQHGKPFVRRPSSVVRPFNVTHTDGLVMCAICGTDHELLGLDVERLDRRTDTAIADRYFSVPEIRFLDRCRSDESRRRTFLRIWTLKESFIKAIGTGLQTPLADFAFEEINSEQPKIRMLDRSLEDDRHWRFFSLEPRPGFIAALAVTQSSPEQVVDYELNDFEPVIADWSPE